MTEHDSIHDRWARLRFSIIGRLLADPPARGELGAAIDALAERSWIHPRSGERVQFGGSTIERWYYQALREPQSPVTILRRKVRSDAGEIALGSDLREVLRRQFELHPSWSYKLHFDNLEEVGQSHPRGLVVPSYSTVRRYMKSHGMTKAKRRSSRDTEGTRRARDRLQKREVRSYEVRSAMGLWHSDFHVCPRAVLTRGGQWKKPQLFGALDDYSRLACHLQWYIEDECTETFVHGLSQAFQKRGLPRSLITDRGAAMMAHETQLGLSELGVLHEPTLAESPYQNGKQETFWEQVDKRLMAMLEDVEELTLSTLNEATQAWVELEYNRETHSEIGTTPLKRFLDGPTVGRERPDTGHLKDSFRLKEIRTQRQSDGTVSIEGQRFEIPSRYRQHRRVTVRYARWDLSRVDIIDPRTNAILAPIYPLDKAANSDRRRRTLPSGSEPILQARRRTGEIAPLLNRLIEDYRAAGLPPAYIPNDNEESEPDES